MNTKTHINIKLMENGSADRVERPAFSVDLDWYRFMYPYERFEIDQYNNIIQRFSDHPQDYVVVAVPEPTTYIGFDGISRPIPQSRDKQ